MRPRIALARCFAGLLLAAGLCVPTASAQKRDTFSPVQDAPRRANAVNGFVQRLMEVEPERRKELLANNRRFQRLPAAQRKAIEDRLREFDKLPAERRELLIQRYQLFSSLGPNQQTQARTLFRVWTGFPRERRTAIAQAVRRLRNAQPDARTEMLKSERFTELFDESEQDLIEKLLELAPAQRNRNQTR